MKLHRLQYQQRFPVPLDAAWTFFSDPGNLAAITPAWLDFQVTSKLPAEMYSGLLVTYRIRPFPGFSRLWLTEVTHLRKPFFFVDEQRLGPYRFWHHQHHFRSIEGGVEVTDLVHYALPFGPVGSVLHRWSVRPRLEQIFTFRLQVLAEKFGSFPGSGGG